MQKKNNVEQLPAKEKIRMKRSLSASMREFDRVNRCTEHCHILPLTYIGAETNPPFSLDRTEY